MFAPVYITDMNCATPIGQNLAENWAALLRNESGIKRQTIGHFSALYTSKIQYTVEGLSQLSFLENLLLLSAQPMLKDKVINARTGLILSSTKGNIERLDTEQAEGARLFSIADKIAQTLGFSTRPIVVSHACISGVLAAIVAKRLIQMGQFDEVLVLATDQVSEFVISGFNAFQAMSSLPCKPFDKDRSGVTLGEAAVAVWISGNCTGALVEIIGEGAVNDANHISGPSRSGEGLYQSIQAALKEAAILPDAIDFISAHGTATSYNDEMEAIAFERAGVLDKPLNSLKGYYGHTLGASGLLELVVSIQSLTKNTLIPTKGYTENGTSKAINVIQEVRELPLSIALKTASGFGGSNAAIIVKKI